MNAQPTVADHDLKFEVASVKPSAGDGRFGPIQILPGGRFKATNVPLRSIITKAYGVRDYQLTGRTEWLDKQFVVEAQAPEGSFADEQILLMIQNLLAERFQLKLHHASKDLPVYAMVIAKGGVKFKETTETKGFTGFKIGEIIAPRITMDRFSNSLSGLLDLPVMNETNLTGLYEFRLHYDPSSIGMAGPPGRDFSNEPSIFTALQEQLGLKLESKTEPVDVLVIDHIERPSAN